VPAAESHKWIVPSPVPVSSVGIDGWTPPAKNRYTPPVKTSYAPPASVSHVYQPQTPLRHTPPAHDFHQVVPPQHSDSHRAKDVPAPQEGWAASRNTWSAPPKVSSPVSNFKYSPPAVSVNQYVPPIRTLPTIFHKTPPSSYQTVKTPPANYHQTVTKPAGWTPPAEVVPPVSDYTFPIVNDYGVTPPASVHEVTFYPPAPVVNFDRVPLTEHYDQVPPTKHFNRAPPVKLSDGWSAPASNAYKPQYLSRSVEGDATASRGWYDKPAPAVPSHSDANFWVPSAPFVSGDQLPMVPPAYSYENEYVPSPGQYDHQTNEIPLPGVPPAYAFDDPVVQAPSDHYESVPYAEHAQVTSAGNGWAPAPTYSPPNLFGSHAYRSEGNVFEKQSGQLIFGLGVLSVIACGVAVVFGCRKRSRRHERIVSGGDARRPSFS